MGENPIPAVAEAAVKESRETSSPGISSAKGAGNFEKLVVEFDVEKVVDKGYGIQEKLLAYRGERTKYKGIVKDGELVAIVSRGYVLVPNRLLLEKLRMYLTIDNGRLHELGKRTRMSVRIPLSNGFEVLVSNSEDGSMTLSVVLGWHGVPLKQDVITKLKGEVKLVRRRHVGKLGTNLVAQAIAHYRELVTELGPTLTELMEKRIDNGIREILKDVGLPKKYLPKVVEGTVGNWLSAVSMNLWSANLKENVRQNYLKTLGDVLSAIALMLLTKS